MVTSFCCTAVNRFLAIEYNDNFSKLRAEQQKALADMGGAARVGIRRKPSARP